MIESPYFDLDSKVYLKLECTQPSGSFKSRGITTVVSYELEKDPNKNFYTSSAGNAGIAIAEAAGSHATVVCPTTTPLRVIEKMRKWGANVVTHGLNFTEADLHLQEIYKQDPRGFYCHPFNHPLLWKGHSTMVDEIKRQLNGIKPGAVALSAGGAGMFIGIMLGLIDNGWEDVPVFVVETEGSSAFHQSLAAGHQITIEPPTSIAASLGARWVPEKAIELAKSHDVTSVLVSDSQTLAAIRKFADHHNIIVEPACGATLAAVYGNMITARGDGPIVTIVCGGSLYSIADFNSAPLGK